MDFKKNLAVQAAKQKPLALDEITRALHVLAIHAKQDGRNLHLDTAAKLLVYRLAQDFSITNIKEEGILEDLIQECSDSAMEDAGYQFL